MLELYRAVTGRLLEEEEAYLIAERITNIERLFNVREGLGRVDDTLPKRLLTEPMPTGSSTGSFVSLTPMLEEYYTLMGWDADGIPTSERLQQLGLEEEWSNA
jgi:aldehyde:ferredoxin oxidoreductase